MFPAALPQDAGRKTGGVGAPHRPAALFHSQTERLAAPPGGWFCKQLAPTCGRGENLARLLSAIWG